MRKSRTYLATPPGATIKEQLHDRGMSQKELAARMEMSEKHISRLINGDVILTPDVAMRLEMVLGIPARFWSNLESIYREKLAKVEEENNMDEDIKISKELPYNEMVKNQWINKADETTQKIINLRKFFEVVRLSLIEDIHPPIACRRLSITKKSDFTLIALAQKAKIEARNIETSSINLKKLLASLPQIRKFSTMRKEDFLEPLIELLSDSGVALVLLPHINGSFFHGATFKDGSKIIIGLTTRGKDADKFWFSLFHEIGHILLKHLDREGEILDCDEKEADEFAKNTLIPLDAFLKFVKTQDFSKESIESFARKINIDAGIVVGRLQKEKLIEYSWHNKLKKQYDIM